MLRDPHDLVEEYAAAPQAGRTWGERRSPCRPEPSEREAALEAAVEMIADAVIEEEEPRPLRDLPPAARRLVGC